MKDIFLTEGRYSVQNLKILTDQTRYKWDSKRTFADQTVRFLGFYTVIIGKYLLNFRTNAVPLSTAMSTLLLTIHHLLSIVCVCVCFWKVELCASRVVSSISVTVCRHDVASRCKLRAWRWWRFIRWYLIYRTVEMPSWSAAPFCRYCRARYTTGRTHQLIRYEVLSLRSSWTRYSVECQ
jgi:hypothetical protein